jgi:predicted anti-sigma-YlaC factor YlaD
MFNLRERACRKYQIRMEEYLDTPQAAESDAVLTEHLRECHECRESFAAAQLSQRLFTNAEPPPMEYAHSEPFVTRVMASIREEQARISAPGPMWRPVEILASRFALVAAVVLLALSVFLGEFAPALRQSEFSATTTTEITGEWPEPPAQPATQDEILMTLVDADNGI